MPQTTRCEVIEQKVSTMPTTLLPRPRKHCMSHKKMLRIVTESQSMQKAQGAQLNRIEGRLDLWMERNGHAPTPAASDIRISAGNTSHDTSSSVQQDGRPTGGVDPLLIKLTLVAVIMCAAAYGGPSAWALLSQAWH